MAFSSGGCERPMGEVEAAENDEGGIVEGESVRVGMEIPPVTLGGVTGSIVGTTEIASI